MARDQERNDIALAQGRREFVARVGAQARWWHSAPCYRESSRRKTSRAVSTHSRYSIQ